MSKSTDREKEIDVSASASSGTPEPDSGKASRGGVLSLLKPRIPKPWKTRSDEIRERDHLRIVMWWDSIRNGLTPKPVSKEEVSRALNGLSTDSDAKARLMALSKRQVADEIKLHERVAAGAMVIFGLSWVTLGGAMMVYEEPLFRMGAAGGMIACLSILVVAVRSDWRILQLQIREPVGLKAWARCRLLFQDISKEKTSD